jgi:hypothetical protein
MNSKFEIYCYHIFIHLQKFLQYCKIHIYIYIKHQFLGLILVYVSLFPAFSSRTYRFPTITGLAALCLLVRQYTYIIISIYKD